MRIIRKALGLFIVDIAIIIGIFVLQFRTDSNIIEKIGNLQVTFTKSEEQNLTEKNVSLQDTTSQNNNIALDDTNKKATINATAIEGPDSNNPVSSTTSDKTTKYNFKNEIQTNYNGINFNIDKTHPAKYTLIADGKNAVPVNARFVNYHRQENELTLEFDQNISVSFIFADTSDNAGLVVFADLPDSINQFYFPYNFAYSMKIIKNEGKKVVVSNNKKNLWCFSTDCVDDGYIIFSQKDSFAHYALYDDTVKFTFSSLTQLAQAEEGNYNTLLNEFKNELLTSYRNNPLESNYTEQVIVSYVAAMGEIGKYQQAVDEVPQSFKRSELRTFLSAPYFNNLVAMNNTLETRIKTVSNLISKASYSNTLDIYTVPGIAAHLTIYPDKSDIKKILERVSDEELLNNCTVTEAAGILLTYDDLFTLNPEYAAILAPFLDNCVEIIENASKFENNLISISENDNFLSVLQGIEAGVAILRYGEISGNDTYIRAGRVIISSYLSESYSFDLRTLANIYPLIAYNNDYYPHFKIITNDNKDQIWAWTCSKVITCSRDADGSLNLNIGFPVGDTHYIIFKGIPEFDSIYIYNMAFRTDPRFETYNSSGYVYRSTNGTLLIKSKHKSEIENIRMTNKDSKK